MASLEEEQIVLAPVGQKVAKSQRFLGTCVEELLVSSFATLLEVVVYRSSSKRNGSASQQQQQQRGDAAVST
jgi:hypothetical protein